MTEIDTHRPLQGCRIMVTRPLHLANKLSALCAEQGATVIRFPCMEIIDTSHNESSIHKIKQLNKYCLLIFISRNAVYYGIRLLREAGIYHIDIPTAAVGIKTAEALAVAGIANAIHPRDATSSEALAETELIKSMTQGAVLIFRGRGGNPYLGNQLSGQGLAVDYAEVYYRQKPATRLRLDDKRLIPDVITVASGETLTNLYEMTDKDSLPVLLNRQLVLGSLSMKVLHNKLGFKRSPVIARSPIDDDMFQAVTGYFDAYR